MPVFFFPDKVFCFQKSHFKLKQLWWSGILEKCCASLFMFSSTRGRWFMTFTKRGRAGASWYFGQFCRWLQMIYGEGRPQNLVVMVGITPSFPYLLNKVNDLLLPHFHYFFLMFHYCSCLISVLVPLQNYSSLFVVQLLP